MQGAVLVCVSYGKNAEALIKKGKFIAELYKQSCYVLSIENKEYDSKDFTMAEHKKFFEQLANKYQCDFIWKIKGSKRISDIIAKTVDEKNINHVVIGQPPLTKWEVLTKGSIIHELLHILEDVDLQIVSMKREQNEDAEEQFQRGVTGYLVKENDKYELVLDHCEEYVVKGIYFQAVATEFTNGVFKCDLKGKEAIIRIQDSKAELVQLDLNKEVKS
ncbi:hypothetical protein [Alkalihalobacillus pseudalcaliphilus]|uniref:hypothetical protein n=1 Tax=Alkalihalobacillus pseudalcaliphilus TaxID=79884 RepID=UPI00064DCCE9|nr:hypothetical protein [Alkalihalobacillus pseudalcaliphilus]KMK77021.1 hypothetical protein AB990_05550 [Alkalihalobacillus pseudalcaliphilus]